MAGIHDILFESRTTFRDLVADQAGEVGVLRDESPVLPLGPARHRAIQAMLAEVDFDPDADIGYPAITGVRTPGYFDVPASNHKPEAV